MSTESRNIVDYEQTVKIFELLADIRFKLLAFVPTVAAAAVALSDKIDLSAPVRSALGVLGFIVTIGFVFYDQRNTQFYNRVVTRAKVLEDDLGLRKLESDVARGIFGSRPGLGRRLFGLVEMRHDRGLGLVYASAFGAWAFVATAALLGNEQRLAAALVVAIGFFFEFERLDGRFRGLRAWLRRRLRPRWVPFNYKLRKDLGPEIVYELTSSQDTPDWGLAVADITQSAPHVHERTRELYVVVQGEVELQLGERSIALAAGQAAEIPLGVTHSARSHASGAARVVVVTIPAWTAADHMLT